MVAAVRRRPALGLDASPLVDALIGGWQLAGINTVYAGEPVTFTYTPGATVVVSGIAQDFRGANNYRPNVTCDPLAPGGERTITNWFNRACVSCRPIRASRSATPSATPCAARCSGSSISSASKRFALGGPAQFEFRLEAFNLLNRTNFRAPNGNRSAGAFGTITATYDPRQLQLGFKLLW